MSACAASADMECWTHTSQQVTDSAVYECLKEAWEHEDEKDDLTVDIQGLEREYWLGTEAGRLGCYGFPGESWAGDGSAHQGNMGAGSVCHQRPEVHLVTRVGREEEGISSLRPELAAVARTLQRVPRGVDLLYLCDSETTLDKILRWIGQGPRATLAGDANADIMRVIVDEIRERTICGARTFFVKIKAHRGEPLNERADTQAEIARNLPNECKQWTHRTNRMTYEWQDKGITKTSTWSKAVRTAMGRGGAEFQVQKVLTKAAGKWSKEHLRISDSPSGLRHIQQSAGVGASSNLLNKDRWGWECMKQLQEEENRQTPAATTWAAEFLLREGESREILGQWMNAKHVNDRSRRRATQVITSSFPCGKWLHKIGARSSPKCELCMRRMTSDCEGTEAIPDETVAHIQSAGCALQKKSVIGAHNTCWKFLLGAITKHGSAKRDLEVIGGERDRQLTSLWQETAIGEILPWDRVEETAEMMLNTETRCEDDVKKEQQVDQEEEDWNHYNEVIFGKRRPDAVGIDWANNVIFVMEFKRVSDQRRCYRSRGEERASKQHDVLIRSLEKVALEMYGEGGWKVKLLVFVGGTSGSVHTKTLNDNLKELQVVESKHQTIRKGLVWELLNAQDRVLCSYFAQRNGRNDEHQHHGRAVEEIFQEPNGSA